MLVSMTSWRIVWVLRHDLDHHAKRRHWGQVPTFDDQDHCSDYLGHRDKDCSDSRLGGKTDLQDILVSSFGSGCKAIGLASNHA
jgi:hypothetical protein